MELEILVFGLLILIIITFLVLTFIPISFNSPTARLEGPYSLNKSTSLFDSKVFQSNASTTFQGFFYLDNLQKTGITTPCSSTDQSAPNCDSGRYALCSCEGTNCSNCAHNGYIQLANLNDIVSLEILGSPDSSRQGKAAIQLTIKTQTSAKVVDGVNTPIDTTGTNDNVSQLYIETFILPPIPYQKWIMISISREGRRFDIYYNDTLVLSKYTSTNLYNQLTNTILSVGDPSLSGQSGFFNLYTSIQSANDISSQYNTFINTRGLPLFTTPPPTLYSINTQSIMGVSNIPSLCSAGNCIQSPVTAPAKPYYEWSSSYA